MRPTDEKLESCLSAEELDSIIGPGNPDFRSWFDELDAYYAMTGIANPRDYDRVDRDMARLAQLARKSVEVIADQERRIEALERKLLEESPKPN